MVIVSAKEPDHVRILGTGKLAYIPVIPVKNIDISQAITVAAYLPVTVFNKIGKILRH